MERLTEKIKNIQTGKTIAYRAKRDVSTIQAIKRLGEYEDREERLLKEKTKENYLFTGRRIGWRELEEDKRWVIGNALFLDDGTVRIATSCLVDFAEPTLLTVCAYEVEIDTLKEYSDE